MNAARESGGTAVRTLTGLLLAAFSLAVIWLPGFHAVFVAYAAALVAVGAWEFAGLAHARGVAVPRGGLAVVSALVVLAAYEYQMRLALAVFAFGVLALSTWHLRAGARSLTSLSVSVFGVAYTGLFGAHFCAMHALPHGPALVTLLAVAIVLSDTGAYFAGKTLGRRKMAPNVSPKKTWEGSIGGLVLAGAGMLALWLIALHGPADVFPKAPWYVYCGTGLVLAAIGQVGDLIESMLKRDAGIKDSGALFPGHGGVLDRCDGFLFTAPVLYHLAVWL